MKTQLWHVVQNTLAAAGRAIVQQAHNNKSGYSLIGGEFILQQQ